MDISPLRQMTPGQAAADLTVFQPADAVRAAGPATIYYSLGRAADKVTVEVLDAQGEIDKLLHSVKVFPERAHLVGAYSLGKAQRVMALIRKGGYDRPIYLHGALESITRYYQSRGVDLGDIRLVKDAKDQAELAGAIALCPPSSLQDLWTRRFPDPVSCFASGWMRVRARARQRGVEFPLVISDHADWPELCATMRGFGTPSKKKLSVS